MHLKYIDVIHTSVQRSPPKSDVFALITFRRRIDRRYTITGAIDASTAERVDLAEALRRGLIDETDGHYFNSLTQRTIPAEEAVFDGWILAEFDDTRPEYEKETYAVISVVDQLLGRAVSFVQAVRRKLIDYDTGSYVDNRTRKKVYMGDAFRQGLVKGRLVPSVDGLEIFASLNLVVDEERPPLGGGAGGPGGGGLI